MQSKLEIYGRKKMALLYALLGMVFIFGAIITVYTIVSHRWDLLALCCGAASLLCIIILTLVNLPADVTLDYEKKTVLSKVPFRKECGFEIEFEEIQKASILTREELKKFYQGKRLPKRALCFHLSENQVTVMPGTWFSNKQLQFFYENIKANGEGCK